MNKKGYDFAAIFLIFILLTIIALTYTFSESFAGIKQTVGETQEPFLGVSSDEQAIKRFVKQAGEQAVEGVKEDLCRAEYSGKGCSTEQCPLLNTQAEPQNVCIPDLYDSIQDSFQKNMQRYALQFRQEGVNLPTTYVLGFDPLTVISPESVRMNIIGIDETVGLLAFKPNVALDAEYDFSIHRELVEQVLQTTDCAGTPEPSVCVQERIPEGWQYENTDDLYTFTHELNDCSVCYTLYLPSENSTPEI